MMELLRYAGYTIVLAFVDALRIRLLMPQKKKNIRKWISWGLAVAAGAGDFLLFTNDSTIWKYVLMCAGVRLALYDPLLNVMRGFRIDYVSERTNSWVDRVERWMGLSFWMQRLVGVCVCLIYFL